MYTVKVGKNYELNVRNNGTVASITTSGTRHKCMGAPVVLDPERLFGTVLRVEASERAAAQRAFDVRYESAAFRAEQLAGPAQAIREPEAEIDEAGHAEVAFEDRFEYAAGAIDKRKAYEVPPEERRAYFLAWQERQAKQNGTWPELQRLRNEGEEASPA